MSSPIPSFLVTRTLEEAGEKKKRSPIQESNRWNEDEAILLRLKDQRFFVAGIRERQGAKRTFELGMPIACQKILPFETAGNPFSFYVLLTRTQCKESVY